MASEFIDHKTIEADPVPPPSVFEMLKAGIGPSSSHTLGPWRAAQQFAAELQQSERLANVAGLRVDLYGSLALTGVGHGTDIAIMMGLSGEDPVTVDQEKVSTLPEAIHSNHALKLDGQKTVVFDPNSDIRYLKDQRLPQHANGMKFHAFDETGRELHTRTAYSVGGGFVSWEGEMASDLTVHLPYPIHSGDDLLHFCRRDGLSIAELALANERTRCEPAEIESRLMELWDVMKDSVHRGCSQQGILPGGLGVRRRAPTTVRELYGGPPHQNFEDWLRALRDDRHEFPRILKWVSCFAMAVNEVNAAFGRIVTAPTNGSAGVIPAVLMYYLCFCQRRPDDTDIQNFLMTAAVVGGLFKTGATISAAMGGCQAEIGVSSSMAAAALTEALGGSPEQTLQAAEIAMEHHLGLTCDPLAGLVQVPCIERNSMGAIKAITAAHMMLDSDASSTRVSLDEVIRTMWATARDMNEHYKETSLGGLAVNVSVRLSEC